MKVLLCSPYHSIGGISKWTHQIEEYHADNPGNIDLDIMPMESKKYLGENASFFKRVINSSKPYLQFVNKFAKQVKGNKPDIVHICSSGSLGLVRDYLLVRICSRNRIPCVIHVHNGTIPDLYKKRNWEWHLLMKVLGRTAAAVVLTQDSKQVLSDSAIKNVYKVPNPITPAELDFVDNHRHEYSLDRFIFAGHILPTKGIHELLGMMTKLQGKQLLVLGEDTQRLIPGLKIKYKQAFDNNSIIFTGQVDRNRVFKEISSGIFILPSYSEGFPYVILESMACGVPIISTYVGAVPEILDVHAPIPCGICVKPRDSEELLKATRFLCEHADYAKKIASNAYIKVRATYSIDKIHETLTAIWHSIL